MDRFEEIRTGSGKVGLLPRSRQSRVLHAALKDMDGIRIPTHFPSHSTDRVLTMSRLYGVPVSEFVENSTPEARQRAAMNLVTVFHEMAYKLRALHSDPHPGNYLFEEDGTVGLLDFGCVKRFDVYFMANYARMGCAGIAGNRDETLDLAREIGALKGDDPAAEELLWQPGDIMEFPSGKTCIVAVSEDNLHKKLQMIAPSSFAFLKSRRQECVYLHRALAGVPDGSKVGVGNRFSAMFYSMQTTR